MLVRHGGRARRRARAPRVTGAAAGGRRRQLEDRTSCCSSATGPCSAPTAGRRSRTSRWRSRRRRVGSGRRWTGCSGRSRPAARSRLVCCVSPVWTFRPTSGRWRTPTARAGSGCVVLENDTIAGLRAGSPSGWGVGVVVGAGINAVGVAPGGRRARFAGLGPLSGDRGGGGGLGLDALGAAVRAGDRRGERTSLERLVPQHFGMRRPIDVTLAMYHGRLPEGRVAELAAIAVSAARDGDAVALGLLGDLAGECAAFATAAIRRLGITRLEVPVVLSGGVARGAGELLASPVRSGCGSSRPTPPCRCSMRRPCSARRCSSWTSWRPGTPRPGSGHGPVSRRRG